MVDDKIRKAAASVAAAAPAGTNDDDQDTRLSVWTRLMTIWLQFWESAWSLIEAKLSQAEKTITCSAPLWVLVGVVLVAVFVACDPFDQIAYFMDSQITPCAPHECLLPTSHLNAWPADPDSKLLNSSLVFNTEIPGPESLAWDSEGRIYTGVADGRVIRWNAVDGRWQTFAVISPYWSREKCDFKVRGKEYPALEHVCGRPLGLKFAASGSLYVADAYFGLAVVGPQGGVATILCNQSDGQVHQFTNDLDIDNENGMVYFTVSSLRSQRRQCNRVVQTGDKSGKVLKYEIGTGKTTVLLKDFQYPNGIALSGDSSFLLIVSTSSNRIRSYWLKGPRSGENQEFAQLPGYGDNIRATEDGRFFWVALHSRRTQLHYFLSTYPRLARLSSILQSMSKKYDMFVIGEIRPVVIKYNMDGEAVQVLEDRTGLSQANFVSTAQERQGALWLSSIYLPSILVYNLGS